MNGLRIIRMDPSDNIRLIGCYMDDWIDRFDQIIRSNLVYLYIFYNAFFFFLKKKNFFSDLNLDLDLDFGLRNSLGRLGFLKVRKFSLFYCLENVTNVLFLSFL